LAEAQPETEVQVLLVFAGAFTGIVEGLNAAFEGVVCIRPELFGVVVFELGIETAGEFQEA